MGDHEPDFAEFNLFVHRAQHALDAERGLKPNLWSCWWPMFAEEVPPWAQEAADRGERPTAWCPVVNPALVSPSGVDN